MKWAIKNELRTEATPWQKAICPLCSGEVTSKCGDIKIWHWGNILSKNDLVIKLKKEGENGM